MNELNGWDQHKKKVTSDIKDLQEGHSDIQVCMTEIRIKLARIETFMAIALVGGGGLGAKEIFELLTK